MYKKAESRIGIKGLTLSEAYERAFGEREDGEYIVCSRVGFFPIREIRERVVEDERIILEDFLPNDS